MMKRLMDARHQGESGYTLTEVIVALSILSVSVVAIVGAMSSSIFSSRVHRSIVTGDTAVRAYAEQILEAPYLSCANPGQYPVMTNPPGAITVTIASITYWNGSSSGSNFTPTCSADQGAQRIVIVSQPQNNAGKQSLAFVKRAP
jgi:prepilin-type N-terminal cleavage/methylation domain-containing protein